MELEKKIHNKFRDLNPPNIKENNINIVNIFGTSLKSKKNINNSFKEAVKLKRNFK